MKKRALLPALFLLLSGACIYYAAAAGGSSSDPLISLSYLNSTYTDTVYQQVAALKSGAPVSGLANADTWTETRLKSGDVLSGSTGTCVLPTYPSLRMFGDSVFFLGCSGGCHFRYGNSLWLRPDHPTPLSGGREHHGSLRCVW